MDKNNLTDNETKIFLSVLDIISKYVPPLTKEEEECVQGDYSRKIILTDIINASIEFTNKIISEIKAN
jgi:hypothetical protein